jgi:hypothetical protein
MVKTSNRPLKLAAQAIGGFVAVGWKIGGNESCGRGRY